MVSMLLQNLQRIAHRLQQPQQSQQQKRRSGCCNAPPQKEAAAAALPVRFKGSQRRGAALVFASASPQAAALAAQPRRAEGGQPRPAEPSSGPPEAAAAARAGEHDRVSTVSTAGAAEPPGQEGGRAQAAGQAARGPEGLSPSAAQGQRSGAAGGEARPRQPRHWRWPREWALPHWPPPQLSGFVLPAWAAQAMGGKQKLLTVQQFFNYVENEGRSFFDSLDRNGDGAVSLDDLRSAMRSRKLPEEYAHQFLARARRGRWWVQRVRWPEFKRMVDEKEAAMLRAFTALEGVNAAGKVELKQIKGTLKRLGLEASDDNARAMIQALDAGEGEDGSVSYGKFRNFLILLPAANLGRDPSTAWFEAATIVPFGPPRRKARPGKLLVRAALAGGLASGVTTLAMFPLDTMKARVQATAGASIGSVVRAVPSIGLRGLYCGVVPAVLGQFVSHGTRTAAFEGTLMALAALGAGAGGASAVQWQGLASGVGTVLGTVTRIPAEVLKQRLQVGLHPNAAVALRVAWRETGLPGLFRGTTSLLAREVPFYMFGMMGYAALKRQFDGSAHGQPRELARWEAVALGGLAGALASILTTPADVLKTRIMTADAARSVHARALLASIVREEGLGALWKGALPRACWTAPLGAMNFAGYELAKKALAERERQATPEALERDPG